jgi:two-component system sensor histidine kinase YesM
MTEERLLSLRKLLDSPLSHNGKYNTDEEESLEITAEHGVGLCNVNNRIKLYYGESYRLHIDSEENIGTNIQIKIPFQKNSTLF